MGRAQSIEEAPAAICPVSILPRGQRKEREETKRTLEMLYMFRIEDLSEFHLEKKNMLKSKSMTAALWQYFSELLVAMEVMEHQMVTALSKNFSD